MMQPYAVVMQRELSQHVAIPSPQPVRNTSILKNTATSLEVSSEPSIQPPSLSNQVYPLSAAELLRQVLTPSQLKNLSPIGAPPSQLLNHMTSASHIATHSHDNVTFSSESEKVTSHRVPSGGESSSCHVSLPGHSYTMSPSQVESVTKFLSVACPGKTASNQSFNEQPHLSVSESTPMQTSPATTKSKAEAPPKARVTFSSHQQSMHSNGPLQVSGKETLPTHTATLMTSSLSSHKDAELTNRRPPPGFTRADPGKVSSELAELQLADRKFGSSVRNRGMYQQHQSDSSTLSKSQDFPRRSLQNGAFSPKSSLNIQPLSSKCNNNQYSSNHNGAFSPNHLGQYSKSHNGQFPSSGQYSMSNGGHLSMCNFSPGNSGNFRSKNGYSQPLTPQETLAQLLAGERKISVNGVNVGSSESEVDSDSSDKRAPGWERKQESEGMVEHIQHLDYDQKKLLANRFMRKLPVTQEVRTPTDTWSGLGFSKSMPDSAVRDLIMQNGGFADLSHQELPIMYDENHNEEFAVKKKKQISSLSYSNYIDSSSLPQPPKGLWSQADLTASLSAKMDLSELLISLSLSKYIDVFQQQEIDLATFTTLTDNDLKELGITTFGARRKMLLAISDLNNSRSEALNQLTDLSMPKPSVHFANQVSGGSIGMGRGSPTVCW